MSYIKKLSIVSFFFLLFSSLNVYCIRNLENTTIHSHIRSHSNSRHGHSSENKHADELAASFEQLGEKFAEELSNKIISALQEHSSGKTSFLEDGVEFNFGEQIKIYGKAILMNLIKTGLPMLEKTIADSLKPPHVTKATYASVTPVVKSMFNSLESKVHLPLSSDIWKYKKDSTDDEDLDEDEGDDLTSKGDDDNNLDDLDFDF